MLTEIALEALRYFGRATLEGLQMHSRHLRDLVDRNARTLALRYIQEVVVSASPFIWNYFLKGRYFIQRSTHLTVYLGELHTGDVIRFFHSQ